MFIIEQKYGNDGYAFWFKLLEMLGNTKGHLLKFENDMEWEFLIAKTHLNKEICIEILDLLAKLGAIDKNLWNKKKVVWSDNFIENIKDAYRNRTEDIPSKPSFLCKKSKDSKITSARNPHTILKETKLKNIYIDILNFWNSKKIIVHEKTDELLESIEKIIKKKKYKKDNIIQAIKNYSTVLDDKKYFFKYIWSLENFLSRWKALPSFLEGGESWENYKQQNKDRIAIQEAKKKENEWEDKKEKRDDYKHKPIPKKIKKQIHKILNIPDKSNKDEKNRNKK